jgi:hypothetical protein
MESFVVYCSEWYLQPVRVSAFRGIPGECCDIVKPLYLEGRSVRPVLGCTRWWKLSRSADVAKSRSHTDNTNDTIWASLRNRHGYHEHVCIPRAHSVQVSPYTALSVKLQCHYTRHELVAATLLLNKLWEEIIACSPSTTNGVSDSASRTILHFVSCVYVKTASVV